MIFAMTSLGIDTLNQLSIQYGIFGALFILLLFYVLKSSSKREKEYQGIITKVNDEILNKANCNGQDIGKLSKDVDVIDQKIQNIDTKVDAVDRKVDAISIKVDSISGRINY